uniref:Uncharacterized protein n=1 Tax=Arundo donax TaxID=35708 RepID=A0A0A9BEL3_ARUDO
MFSIMPSRRTTFLDLNVVISVSLCELSITQS